METYNNILVISRMTPYSRSTIKIGVSLALKYKAKLHILHIVSDPVDLMTVNSSGLFPEIQYTNYFNSQKEAKKQLDKVIKQELRNDIAMQELVSDRDSIEDTLKVVSEQKIDLILITAHEEGRIEHALFGGENDALLRKMPCSILFVKNEPDAENW